MVMFSTAVYRYVRQSATAAPNMLWFLQEAAGLREQVQALQEEIASLQAANARVQSEFEQATAARKSAESTARECGVALKQKDAELSFVKMTNENDAQRDKDMIQKLQVRLQNCCVLSLA